MNYKRIYDQIVERAKNRDLIRYREKHHIIPKCIGGSNSKENLVELTAREHFVCHILLCEIHPNNLKLMHAAWMMSECRSVNHKRFYNVSSRTYQRLKEDRANLLSKSMKGEKNPMYGNPIGLTKDNSGEKNPMYGKRGKNNPNFGKKYPEQSDKMKKSNPMFRKDVVENVRAKLVGPRPNARKPKNKIQCPHCSMKCAPHLVYRYHFDYCKLKLL